MAVQHAETSLTESERLRILAHLQDLLQSPAFAASRRRQDFLRYVVEETLAGRGSAIKETTIAVDVFGRSSDFDAQSASIVRVTGGEVRKRLAQVYASGCDGGVRIDLPLGGYQPAFQFVPAESLAETVAPPPPKPAARLSRRRVWVFAAAGALVAAAFFGGPRLLQPADPLDLLWQPFLNKSRPVLISVPTPTLVYIANREKWLPLRPGVEIPTSEMEAMEASYVGTGGALGAALFTEQLVTRGQHFALKFGADLSFADLKNSPAILIGTLPLTQELTRPLRFRITGDGERMTVLDSQQPERNWSIHRNHPPAQRAEGYSLITRLMHAESGLALLLVAGMDPRNTQAAVEFLSQRERFEQFAKQAPPDWPNKNFQIVLHNTIHGNSPGSMTVLASHIW